MMLPESEKNLPEAAILTRAVENVFRKLIRFLVGKISLVKLQEMIRFIYVEESERKLRRERPHTDVALTRLAFLTGLDTRTLSKTRSNERYRKPLYKESRFIKAMTPGSCVLDVWISTPKFLDKKTGKPAILPLYGEDASFEMLVKEAVNSRGVTAQSILASLVENQEVAFDEPSGCVELLQKIQAPFKAGNEWGVFEIGMLQVGSLLDTIFHNFLVTKNGGETFYDRGCWTHRLSCKKRFEFRETIKKFLEDSDEKARVEIEQFEESSSSEEQLTAGIFMYYFEEKIASE
jgi:hypothetical protein